MLGGRRPAFALLALAAGLLALGGSAAAASRRAAALPDLRILVPTNLISIGVDPDTGRRELRFTHITADVGPGPFELDPHYDAKSGVSAFSQALYDAHGKLVRRVPLAVYGTWEPPSDYRYPLTSFTLNKLGPGGSVGAVVARSPKVDYCITGDTQVSGVPHTPDQTFIPVSDCTDPTLPLGWSVGWGDQYDQTDAGQPIGLAGVPDGTYVLRATVDPEHVLHEVGTANDVTDTTLRIGGDQVTVLSQRVVAVALPRVRLSGLRAGQDVYGSLTLKARIALPSGRSLRSLQFLLDGRPLGPSLTRPPFRYLWSPAAKKGGHYLSARAADSQGVESTAPVVRVVLSPEPPLHVTRLAWHAGLLHLRLRAPRGSRVVAIVPGKGRFAVRGGRLDVRCRRPGRILVDLLAHGRVTASLALPLDARPAVQLVNPGRGETVSGIVPLAAQASDSVGVRSVQFLLGRRRLSPPLRHPPYRWHWDTRKLRDGLHVLRVRAVDVLGHATTNKVRVRVSNPAPPMTCFVLQHHARVRGASPLATTSFRTVVAGETLLAFVSADGPEGSRQTATVSGGGLTWRRIVRENASPGDAEVWEAVARKPTGVSAITATLSSGGYDESLNVIAMEGADGVGASAGAAGSSGAPHLELTTLAATSLVLAAGNDWDSATARQLPAGWVLLDQWLNTGTGDTFWTQYTNRPTGNAGSRVTVSDLAPTGDHWNLAAVELVNSGN